MTIEEMKAELAATKAQLDTATAAGAHVVKQGAPVRKVNVATRYFEDVADAMQALASRLNADPIVIGGEPVLFEVKISNQRVEQERKNGRPLFNADGTPMTVTKGGNIMISANGRREEPGIGKMQLSFSVTASGTAELPSRPETETT